MTAEAVVLLNPDHPYASALSAACQRFWGIDTVSVVPDERSRRRTDAHRLAATLSPDATYTFTDDDPCAVAATLADHHEVRAVLPHSESQVFDAARLEEALGISGADVATAALFRNKAALKAHLRAQPDGPRINDSTLVTTAADVLAARTRPTFEYFVLKPNSGSGNRAIAFFDRTTSSATISDYVDQVGGAHGESVVMEERLTGTEYCVNGQCDAEGNAVTFSVFRTRHASANGREQLAEAFELVPRHSPIFATLSAYAEHVVTAAGLRRHPFHLELIVDGAGPCLVEVAARLGGAGMAFDTGHAHGGVLDPFAEAAAAALGRGLPAGHGPDWNAYDSRALRTLCGVSSADDRITSLRGVHEVESMPEFVRWVHRPRLGQRRHRTIDLATIAWQVTVAGGDEHHLDDVEARVREELVINRPRRRSRTVVDSLGTAAVRATSRLRQLAGAP